MPNIPGLASQQTSSPIPGLGQGFRGGAVGLTGLPGALPAPPNPGLVGLPGLPRIGAPDQSSTPLLGSTNAGNNSQGQFSDATRKRRLQQANEILSKVRSGHMDAARAKPMIDQLLGPDEKNLISRGMLVDDAQTGSQSHHDELQALGFVPIGKNPGQTASMDPTHAPSVGTHLLQDLGNTVVNMPAGMYATGRAIGEDVKDIPGNLIHGRGSQDFRHTKAEVISPIGKAYAHTYGPLAQGDFGEFAHRLGQHPLGPILDAASLASAGLGAGARTADALAAVRAGRIEELAGGTAGASKVGDFTVQEFKQGGFGVRHGNEYVATNLPSQAAAEKVAQSLSTAGAMRGNRVFGVSGDTVSRAAQGFIKGGGARGRFLDNLNEQAAAGKLGNAGKTLFDHTKENESVADELVNVLNDPSVFDNKRSWAQYRKDTKAQMMADFRATRAYGREKAHLNLTEPRGTYGPVSARVKASLGTTLREATDLVRIGAIYLRPAYLPNNWVGNGFMNLTHQGVLAPLNLAKSFVMDKQLGKRYTAAIDKTLGSTPAKAVESGVGRGYISSAAHPLVSAMGAAADQPFRRAAWLHEARRDGLTNLGQIKSLMDSAANGDRNAQLRVADIGRRAQDEVVKFNGLSGAEKDIVQRLVFVYSWMRGAGRYGLRYPLQHPIQANVQADLGNDVGAPFVKKELGGGLPKFLLGSIPVGKDKNGNPILINPFSLNPLGSAVQAGQAISGSINAARGKGHFNPFSDTDITSLSPPLIQGYLTARGGGKSLETSTEQTFAPYRFVHDLMHPGTGSIFPTSRKEAVGHFLGGSMFPRTADQQALTRSIEREKQGDPISRLPLDVQTITKAFGQNAIDPSFVQQYVTDLHEVQRMKDFQAAYALKHGSSGFRNMPPTNRAEAAIEFLAKGHATPAEVATMKSQLKSMKTDAEIAQLASALWSSTGIGGYKTQWDQMLHQARAQRLSRARQ